MVPIQVTPKSTGFVPALVLSASQSVAGGLCIVVCNTDSSARTYSISMDVAGGATGVTKALFRTAAIPANTTVIIPLPMKLEGPGLTLSVQASVADLVTFTIGDLTAP